MTSLKAIIYARVSSTSQSADDRISLDEQASQCLAYANNRGYEVVDVIREVQSAGSVRGRPLLLDAMYRVRNKEAQVLLAYCLDRLTREQAGMFVIDEEVRKGEGRIEFATEEFSDDAIGRFTRSARAFAAEIELERIAARSAMGRRGRLQHGKLLVTNVPLLGYRYAGEHKERYEANPTTAAIVRRVFADYVGGKSINGIVKDLNSEGVPTSTGKGRWHKSQVGNILHNRAYLGEARMMRRKYATDEDGHVTYSERPESETVLLPEGTIPPLIPQSVFDRAQLRLDKNKEALHDPQAHQDALLRGGFVKCGGCGCTMIVARRPNFIDYHCQTSHRASGAGQCTYHTISARKLDSAVWSRVEAILSEPERLRRILALPARDLTTEVASIEDRIEELKREGSGLARTVARLEEGDDAAETLLASIREVAQRRRVLEESRDRLVQEATDAESRARRVDATIEAVSGLSEHVGALDYQGKRQAMIDLGVQVEVYPRGHESGEHWVMVAAWQEQGRLRLSTAGVSRAAESSTFARAVGRLVAAPLTLQWTDASSEPREAA